MVQTLALDHLAVLAPTLETGLAHVRACLGVDVPPGGKHPAMGTHNHVARLGPDSYLEVIAIDPTAPRPPRARWFGLDALAPTTPPRLGTWIVRTDTLDAALAALPGVSGPAIAMTRDTLSWRINVADDGSLPYDGIFPTLIGWPPGPWPGTSMPDLGLKLERLVLEHPQCDEIERALSEALADRRISFVVAGVARLRAQILTPQGLRWLN